MWDGFRKSLSRDFRVISPDLPGYRNSSLTQEELTIEWMADFVKAILDKEASPPPPLQKRGESGDIPKISKPIIIGHSMGGYITLALAEKYPDLAEKIGLFHSHCFADDDEKKQNRQKAIDFIAKNGTSGFVDELYNNLFGEKFLSKNKATVDRLKSNAKKYPAETVIAGLSAMIKRPDRSHVMKSIKQPVLFILGKQDKAIPYQKSLEQCSFPEIADVHLLEVAGHMGMIEELEKTLEIVSEFANLYVKT